ncbi:MAG: lipopolysaccharide heptosyltransferase I [Desulfobulbaceae bacterium]|nr:lipopolysaccharide heptosyltransferase I [Desulfobulbaceae bacterium]
MQNILIVKTSAIGDVTHTLPALNALRRQYPAARITWLVEEAAAGLLVAHPALDRLLVSRRKHWAQELRRGPRRAWAALREAGRFLGQLRDTRYDLLLDFQGLLKSGVLVALARAQRKVGFGRGMAHAEGSWFFLNERIPAVAMDIHALERELLLLKAVGVECPAVAFALPITAAHRGKVEALLAAAGVERSRPLLAINPQATWPTKLWFPERFAELAAHLVAQGWAVVFTGSPADREEIARIIAAMPTPVANLAGETNLLELAALYQLAQVVVSTDTGPMHIAAATGTPVVAIFGSTAPWRTGPWGEQHRVVRVELPCSPCLKRSCPTARECMREISVAMVAAAVDEVK